MSMTMTTFNFSLEMMILWPISQMTHRRDCMQLCSSRYVMRSCLPVVNADIYRKLRRLRNESEVALSSWSQNLPIHVSFLHSHLSSYVLRRDLGIAALKSVEDLSCLPVYVSKQRASSIAPHRTTSRPLRLPQCYLPFCFGGPSGQAGEA